MRKSGSVCAPSAWRLRKRRRKRSRQRSSFSGVSGVSLGARAEGDFVFAREGVGRSAVAHAGELQAVQKQADFGGRVGTDFDALARGSGNKREEAVDAGLAALERRGGREGVDEARVEIAGVAEVDGQRALRCARRE